MTNRPDATYRASRRNLAKAHKLVWRKLERDGYAGPDKRTRMDFILGKPERQTGTVRVMLPRWAWEMPKVIRPGMLPDSPSSQRPVGKLTYVPPR